MAELKLIFSIQNEDDACLYRHLPTAYSSSDLFSYSLTCSVIRPVIHFVARLFKLFIHPLSHSLPYPSIKSSIYSFTGSPRKSRAFFPRAKASGAWSWPLTSI